MKRPNVGEQAGFSELEVRHEFEFDGDAKEVYDFILWAPQRKRPRLWQTQWHDYVVRFAPWAAAPLIPLLGVLFTVEVSIVIRYGQPEVGEPYCRELEDYEAARHTTTGWPIHLSGGACQIWLFQTRPGCCVGQIAVQRDMAHWWHYLPFGVNVNALRKRLGDHIVAVAGIALNDGATRFWADLIGAWSKRHEQDRGHAERSAFEREKPEAAAQLPEWVGGARGTERRTEPGALSIEERGGVTGKPREPDGLQGEVASGSEAGEQEARVSPEKRPFWLPKTVKRKELWRRRWELMCALNVQARDLYQAGKRDNLGPSPAWNDYIRYLALHDGTGKVLKERTVRYIKEAGEKGLLT